MTAIEYSEAVKRSLTYIGLAKAFREPVPESYVETILDLPPPPSEIGADFIAAFEPATGEEACSLHESSYVDQDRGGLFEDLVRCYEYFGLSRHEGADLPDHVAVQLEFMHFLSYLEYCTAARGEAIDGLQRAAKDFLERHLAPLSKAIADNCRTESVRLRALVRHLESFIQKEYSRLAHVAMGG